MSKTRWVVISLLGVGLAGACAEAEDPKADLDSDRDEGGSSASGSGSGGSSAGKAATAGSSSGGKAGIGGTTSKAGAGGKGGAGGTTGNHAGTAPTGGTAGSSSNEGGDTGSGGSSTAGTSMGGTGSTALGCVVEAAGGMPSGEGGGAGEGPIGGDSSGGTPSGMGGADTGVLALFSEDFEAGNADRWTPAGGTWALIDDGSQAYEQTALENKLQIAIVNDVCAADQIIEARVKVTEFKGQSNSYVAALFGRALSPSTHYLLALGSDKKLILRKRINSTSTSATSIGSAVAFTTTPDQWYDVRFELIGTSLKGCVGDVCVSGTDSAIASGSVGVGTVNTSARFDDVRVTAP